MRDLQGTQRASGLVDLLDRVLDKGLVIAGDVKISLAEVELLTIRVRLLVCSVDKAEQIGLDWWRHDKHLSGTGKGLLQENEALREQVRRLEARVESLTGKALGDGRAGRNGSKDGAAPRRGPPRPRRPARGR
ncbi:MAG: gas vesicle protein [Planctomycetota bacterium]|nr:gas vesicle protein [Planctomycetota bacterium]